MDPPHFLPSSPYCPKPHHTQFLTTNPKSTTNMDPKRKIPPSPQSTAEKRQCTESHGKSKKPITFSKSSIAPDVEIDILGNIYHLDSSILRHCSEFFDKSLSTTWWKEENIHFSPDGIKCWHRILPERPTSF
ncbi:hypothetical protein BDD12DRAFT_870414 [Trichophaea hybrida]|nr:hypothetical protein BDD12DRAFT_870414 [Trichophaea hybrida]